MINKKLVAVITLGVMMISSAAMAAYFCKEHNVWHDGQRTYFCKKHNTWHKQGAKFYCREHNTWHTGFGCCHS